LVLGSTKRQEEWFGLIIWTDITAMKGTVIRIIGTRIVAIRDFLHPKKVGYDFLSDFISFIRTHYYNLQQQ
jgi:hypothetical protein